MSKPSLLRQTFLSRQCRRHISASSARRASTSPQRMGPAAAPAQTGYLRSFADIPGPIALPMLRHSAYVLPRIGSFHHTVGLGLLDGLRKKYGDLVRLAKASRTRPVLYIFDPEMMREVYESGVTEPPKWERSPLLQHRKEASTHCPFQGDESKAIWAAIRALLHDGFLLKNYDKAFEKISEDFIQRLETLRRCGNALNEELEAEVYRWAVETIGVLVFGIRLGCLDGPIDAATVDSKSDKTSMDDDTPELCSLFKRRLEDLSPAEGLVRCSMEIADSNYLVRSESTLKTDSQVFNSALVTFDRHSCLTEHFLLEALSQLNTKQLRPEQVLIDKLRPLDRRILTLASDILLAGVDPLAQTAISMFHQLSLHLAQQQRAHDEVEWATESKASGADSPELSYVMACVKEALRVHPATGGVVRRSRQELEVGGYEVPAGVDIVLAHGVTSKSDKQFGRAKAFIPDRWCQDGWEPLRASRAHPDASMPFGTNCPASGVVGHMLASLSSRVLYKYRFEWHGPSPNMVTTGVNKLQKPYFFVLQKAH
ncbi:hypothetical protein ACJJTC_017522 [Scirpophaga incertulas]